ncbi:hypothetical protein MG293_020458 [Ovis ammon polii]|uniref:Uncharacterized protein n=1 Tax=Ovis ammon polii TaxID=230172 RepID=A0AAD4XX36_OVIAM|nr:hypothetical protein MG293_020458 [Ovis ammon polii]
MKALTNRNCFLRIFALDSHGSATARLPWPLQALRHSPVRTAWKQTLHLTGETSRPALPRRTDMERERTQLEHSFTATPNAREGSEEAGPQLKHVPRGSTHRRSSGAPVTAPDRGAPLPRLPHSEDGKTAGKRTVPIYQAHCAKPHSTAFQLNMPSRLQNNNSNDLTINLSKITYHSIRA